MTEPTTTSAGISLTVISVALLGPMAGPYAVILFSSLAGALWPVSAAETPNHIAGAWLLLRCTLTAVVLTAFLSDAIERTWGVPAVESLATVAFMIGALGNGWRPVLSAIGDALRVLIKRIAPPQEGNE